MHLLLINPNISASVSALIEAEARRSASPGTTLEVLTAPFGVAYIETRFEALIGAYAAAQLAAEHHARADAVIVAAFGDPGLAGLREALPCPVTGLSEAALLSACLLGQRFSIVAISSRIRAWYRETVDAQRPGRPPGQHPRPGRAAGRHRHRAGRPGRTAGGAGRTLREGGRRRRHRAGRCTAGRPGAHAGARLPVPAVDGVSSSVRHAESLVALRPFAPRGGSFAPPPVKPNQGLTPALQQLLQRADPLKPAGA
jgi:allantoin racemase